MYQKTYRIKKWFLIALSAVVMLLFLLSMLSLFLKGSFVEKLIVISIFIAVLLIFIEAKSRKVLTADQGILIRKFFRERKLHWTDITQVGMVVIRKRVYLLLTTTKGFHILTNAYEEFTNLLREIVDHVEKEKVDEEVWSRIEHPINKMSDIVSMCFAAAVIAIIIVIKIMTS
jgi:hypothetical protein